MSASRGDRPVCVLVVDDDPLVERSVERILEGFEVTDVDGG